MRWRSRQKKTLVSKFSLQYFYNSAVVKLVSRSNVDKFYIDQLIPPIVDFNPQPVSQSDKYVCKSAAFESKAAFAQE